MVRTIFSLRWSRQEIALSSASMASKTSFNARMRSTKKTCSESEEPADSSFFQSMLSGSNRPVEIAVPACIQNRPHCPVEIRFGAVVILAVAQMRRGMDQAQAGQAAHVRADHSLGKRGLRNQLVQRQGGGGQV